MPDYVCDVYGCGRILPKPYLVALHKRTYHTPAGERVFAFTCTSAGCGYRGDNRYNFAQHVATHNPAVYTHPCTFSGCSYTTTNAFMLTRHMKRHAFAIPLPYACLFCSKRFTEKYNCKAHELRHGAAGVLG